MIIQKDKGATFTQQKERSEATMQKRPTIQQDDKPFLLKIQF